MTQGQVHERAQAWAGTLARSGPARAVEAIRTEIAAAPAAEVPQLVRALRYLHQVLLAPDHARELAGQLWSEAPAPDGPPSPRAAALDKERQLLETALEAGRARAAELEAAAMELARLEEEERALEAERREIEQLLAEGPRG